MIIPETLQRKQVARVLKAKPRPRAGSAQPVRLTSCIFKSLITRVCPPGQCGSTLADRGVPGEAPAGLCTQATAGALRQQQRGRAFTHFGICKLLEDDSTSNPKQIPRSGWCWGSAVQAQASLQGGSGDSTSRSGCLLAFSSWQVTPEDIKRQTRKVKELRRRLAEALQADKIIREEEKVGRGD
nr:methyl-CpG-binding domain protein 3-like 2 [Oryctolagus cuniculus]